MLDIRKNDYLSYLSSFIGMVMILVISFLPRTDFYLIIAAFSVVFFAYYYLASNESVSLRFILITAFLWRLVMFFQLPQLSDDYFRFLWDGSLIHDGISPYAFSPTELKAYIVDHPVLYDGLNSKFYYSVYTPANELIFYLSSFGLDHSVELSIFIYRLIILLVEMLTVWFILDLLKARNLPVKKIVWYVLNPLIIIEFVGNIHAEAFVILFIAVAFWGFYRKKKVVAVIGFALAGVFKLIPILLIMGFLNRHKKFAVSVYVLAFCLMVLSIIPLYHEDFFIHYLTSLKLYFGTFEFNSSVYRIVQMFEGWGVAYFTIWYKLCLPFVFWFLLQRVKLKNEFNYFLLVYTVFLIFSQSIHPWYITPAIFLCLFSDFKFPVLWSYLITWTYITYLYSPDYEQSVVVILVEYIVLFVGISYELREAKSSLELTVQPVYRVVEKSGE